MEWFQWNETEPEQGEKIVIVCDDGCSSFAAFMSDDGPLLAEDGYSLGREAVKNSIWCALPSDYVFRFMELSESDWY